MRGPKAMWACGLAATLAAGLPAITAAPAAQAEPASAADEAQAAAAAPAPRLVAVKFHADWCGSCRAMGSAFTDLANKLDTEPVLFVELDLTTSAGADQAGYLMTVLGAEAVWAEHAGKTGFVLLLDPADMAVVGKLTKEHGFKEMVQAVEDAMG